MYIYTIWHHCGENQPLPKIEQYRICIHDMAPFCGKSPFSCKCSKIVYIYTTWYHFWGNHHFPKMEQYRVIYTIWHDFRDSHNFLQIEQCSVYIHDIATFAGKWGFSPKWSHIVYEYTRPPKWDHIVYEYT